MQYSLVNGLKTEAKPNLNGICMLCKNPTISACGALNIWHWRHISKKNCDDWWESETPWHREWKSNFPSAWRETIHHDPHTNEKHIADVKTMNGVVLEFQNSPIDLQELQSREKFYDKLIWVVNALSFKKNFEFGHKLPNPNSDFPKNIKFYGDTVHMIAYDKNDDKNDNGCVEFLRKINNERIEHVVDKYYSSHYTFIWKRKRKVWLESSKNVFFDFNDGFLWRILYDFEFCSTHFCKAYSKKKFINYYNK
ncbi:hypothetical protein BH10BAC5_BH10BAC5_28450 [soil metagenome]